MAEKAPRRDPNRAPTHPGAMLREDVLPAIGEPVMAVAKKLGVTRQHLHRILAEKAPVTPDMALRLGKFCGNGPALWLRMQQEGVRTRGHWEEEVRRYRSVSSDSFYYRDRELPQ